MVKVRIEQQGERIDYVVPTLTVQIS